ncbi:hypothetical protein BpHYR1_035114 [Brachionus plicatilis]|uniref:Uncharacterized protein n=1 Tax=Brachionus plicatilis TaxID=10195 RepID=A0A3M7RJJ4_BRAPC|nr:hypothetical protein BpHYR1_035114 [Brachionus plicatilis]
MFKALWIHSNSLVSGSNLIPKNSGCVSRGASAFFIFRLSLRSGKWEYVMYLLESELFKSHNQLNSIGNPLVRIKENEFFSVPENKIYITFATINTDHFFVRVRVKFGLLFLENIPFSGNDVINSKRKEGWIWSFLKSLTRVYVVVVVVEL